MEQEIVKNILCSCVPKEFAEILVESYISASKEYRKGNWKYVGNELGQFVESARRIVEHMVFGSATSLKDKLPLFNDSELKKYEQVSTSAGDSWRIIIPRNLYAMYCIRSKRGMIHVNEIAPNKMDATVLLCSAKWILAEMIRLTSKLSFDETSNLIDDIIAKEDVLFWDVGGVIRLLDNKLNAAEKVLCLLYYSDKQQDASLQKAVEYKNSTEFRRLLKTLHGKRQIEYCNGLCSLSPLGIKVAEKIISEKDAIA